MRIEHLWILLCGTLWPSSTPFSLDSQAVWIVFVKYTKNCPSLLQQATKLKKLIITCILILMLVLIIDHCFCIYITVVLHDIDFKTTMTKEYICFLTQAMRALMISSTLKYTIS